MKAFLNHSLRLWIVVPLTITLLFFTLVTPFAKTLYQDGTFSTTLLTASSIKNASGGSLKNLQVKGTTGINLISFIPIQYQSMNGTSEEYYTEEYYLGKLARWQNSFRIRQGILSFLIGTTLAAYGIYGLTKKNNDGVLLTASGISIDVLGLYLIYGKSRAQKSYEKAWQMEDEAEKHNLTLETLHFYARNYRAFRIGSAILCTAGGIWVLKQPDPEECEPWNYALGPNPCDLLNPEEQKTAKTMSTVALFSSAIFLLVWKSPPEKLYKKYRGLHQNLGLDRKGDVILFFSYYF